MSRSSNWFIAATQGSDMTLYAALRKMGITLTPSQEACQKELERRYPPTCRREEVERDAE